jgi:hypothetical protein
MTGFSPFSLQSLVNKMGKVQRNLDSQPTFHFHFYSWLQQKKNQYKMMLDA